MHLFYSTEISTDMHTLDTTESRHCIKVLRLQKGDTVYLTDGKGYFFKSQIIDDNANRCQLQITEKEKDINTLKNTLHIAVAPTKNINRFEWFLEKATEIGITEITPVICEHSERKTVNIDRLTKVLISAIKQSLKASLPKLNTPVTFHDFIAKQTESQKYIAYYDTDNKQLKEMYHPGKDCLILIGPEGDFSKEEIELAKKSGYHPTNLSDSRLRTETAALIACHTVNLLC